MSDEVTNDIVELREVKLNDEKQDETSKSNMDSSWLTSNSDDELLEEHVKSPTKPSQPSRIWSILQSWKKSIIAIVCSILILLLMLSIVITVEIFDKQSMSNSYEL
jgi:hypothetical protein